MPGLDILRGLAVLSVIAYHGLNWSVPGTPDRLAARIGAFASFGWLGVSLFFVLSGFLITGILLDTRSRENYWKSFYVRRVLRILPLYLVVLAIQRLVFHNGWSYLLVCLLYLANFSYKIGEIGYGPLWSLAVEEQFYLLWPYAVKRFQQRTLAIICIGGLLLCPALRAFSVGVYSIGDPYSATWLVCDQLFCGALLAIFLRSRAATYKVVNYLTISLGLLGVALLAIGFGFHILSRKTAAGAAYQTIPFMAIFSCMLLLSLQFGDRPVIYRLSGPIRFWGHISYGAYLVHLYAIHVYDIFIIHFSGPQGIFTGTQLLVRFMTMLVETAAVCLLSRRYFEEYFLRMKDNLVPYSSKVKAGEN